MTQIINQMANPFRDQMFEKLYYTMDNIEEEESLEDIENYESYESFEN